MNIYKNLKDKKIAFLGLGIENQALLKFLIKKKIKCKITICDKRKNIKNIYSFPKNLNISWQLGENYNKNLEIFDIIFRSPGWPLFCQGIIDAKKKNKKIIISSPMKLFFDICPTKNIIGVTGTKGKGTTSSLIAYILKKSGKKVWLGGNIGIAPFLFIEKINKNDWVVLELSSFQLEDIKKNPRIAVMTNFYKEHLAPADPNNPNYHKTMNDYLDAKLNILRYQNKNDYTVINENIKFKILNLKLRNKIKYFTKSELKSKLIGEHNKENVAAAIEVAKIVDIKDNFIKKAVAEFKGLEHRLEFVRELNGVKYYEDSFATTPESSIIALKSFTSPIILLAGGSDKGSNFKNFAKEIKKRVKFVILIIGKATSRINKELLGINYPKNKIKLTYNMTEAVKVAYKNSLKGDIVLLSTGCASFGIFKNYKERGNLFKDEVIKL